WSDDQVPGAGEDVSINLPGSFTIVYSSGAGDTTIHSLTGSDDLSIAGGSLAVSTSSSLSGQLSIAGGSLTLGSNSVLSGKVTLDGGFLNIYGSSGKSVLFPSDSTTVGYVEDFLRHDSGVRWFLVRSSYQSVL